jgi:Histidine kinase
MAPSFRDPPYTLRPTPDPQGHSVVQTPSPAAIPARLGPRGLPDGLREVAHRVKNNLQVISSLLHLRAGAIDDPRLGMLFQESQERLHSMALVHDLLQQADNVARINLAQYAARLIEELTRT